MHNIQEASHKTGISAHTLRAWEKRYQAVVPNRDDLGRRVYSDEQITKLRHLKLLRDSGYAINEIAKLTLSELSDMAGPIEEKFKQLEQESIENQKTLSLFFVELAIKNQNLEILDHEIEKLKDQLDANEFGKKVVCPISEKLNDLVKEGSLSTDQKDNVSDLVKKHINDLIYKVENKAEIACANAFLSNDENCCGEKVAI